MSSLIAWLAALLCLARHLEGLNYQTFCFTKQQQHHTIECTCSKENVEFRLNVDETLKFKQAISVKISDCRVAHIDITLFEMAYNMKNLTLQRIGKLNFDAFLPQKLETIVIEDVGLIPEILQHLLQTKPKLKEFTLRNCVVDIMQMDVFIDVPRERMTFDNVTFLKVHYNDTSIANSALVNIVDIKGCHFKGQIPKYALQFQASQSFEITKCTFSDVLYGHAIKITASHVLIKGNVFAHLEENAISLHHFDNMHSLHLQLENNTIKSMEKDSISFQLNLRHDRSVIKGNNIPCRAGPQCDEKAKWLLTAMKHVTNMASSDKLLCGMLSENQCNDVETNSSRPILAAIVLHKDCKPASDVTLVETILDTCKQEIDEVEVEELGSSSPNRSNYIPISMFLLCFVHLWIS